MLSRTLVWAVVWLAATASPALCQEQRPESGPATMPLDQLLASEIRTVTGASRYQQLVSDAPASVTVVTASEIEDFGYRTLADLLRGVRGFYLTYDRNYTYLGVRGFSRPGDYNTRILVLVDGHRLNDNVYDAVLIGTEFPLDLELIDRVEVVRGPTSTVYGANAFFGVVNIVTRAPAAGPPAITVEGGSLGTFRARAQGSHTFRDGAIVGAFSTYRSRGQSAIAYPELGVTARHLDDDAAWRAFTSARLGAWRFLAMGASREKKIPTGAFGIRIDDPRSRTIDDRIALDASVEHVVKGTGLRWSSGFDWYGYEGTYVSGDERRVNRDASRGAWLSTSANATRRLGAHLFSGGFDWRADIIQDQTSRLDGRLVVDVDHADREYGLWIADDFSVSRYLLLHGAVSWDAFHGYDARTSFRSAAILKPRPGGTVKLLYGSAYRPPNAYERFYYYEPGREPLLRAETVRTAELVAEQQISPGLRVLATAFTSTSRGLLTMVEDDTNLFEFGFQNVQHVRTRGVELESEIRPVTWLAALASYTYQHGHEHGSTEGLTNSPRHLAQARVQVRLPRATAGIEAVHIGRRLSLDGRWAQAGTLVNATLSGIEAGDHLRLALSVQNLFDATLVDPARPEHPVSGIVQDGRTARVRATWTF